MAQDPLGDAAQQPWYPQQPQQDWQTGYPDQQQWQGGHGYDAGTGYAEAGYPEQGQTRHGRIPYGQIPQDYGQGGYGQGGQPQSGYGQGAYPGAADPQAGYAETGPGHPDTGYGQGRYPDGGHQPYYRYDDHEQQRYAPYAVPQQPTGEELYAPAGAEYSADGYVHTEPEPAVGPEAFEPDPGAAFVAPEPVGRTARSAGRRGGGGTGGGKGGTGAVKAAGGARAGLGAKARAAADAVVSADHAPDRRALAIRTGAGVAALGVLVAAALVVGAQDGGDASARSTGGEPGFTVAHAKIWSAQPAALKAGADGTLVGSWLLADAVVRADATGVHAYDLAAGKPTWSVESPAAGTAPCGLSATVNEAGVGAVLFRSGPDPKSPCSLVAAVDTKSGRTVWSKPLSEAKGGYSARVGVTEDKVIAVGDDHVVAWESADGKDVWQYTGQGKFCTLSGGVTGKTVMVASSCADSTPVDQAVSLNTADGKVSWWRGLNNQPKTVTVLSAEPSVVLTTGEKPEDDKVFAWGPAGDPAAEIPVAAGEGRLDAARGTFSAIPGVFFQDRTMVTTLAPANAGGAVSVVGYDLDSGKQRWKAAAAEKGDVRAVGVDGGALVLAADERRDQPAHLSRFALAGGQETVGGNFPQGTGSLLVSGRVLIGGGRVVAVPEHSANFGTAAGYQAKG
ncbi:PQQ-binding-like beta-propeller repeat protein [Kitasatospora sp. NPDC059327]|uniref:outer membrane protein assembly factor BamB family protein n=1 Tax=Kitasatospora sp. NPDC059327 TaxID=3346803 RepID=UPI0036B67633